MAQGTMKANGIFTDVTSQFTYYSTYLTTFKAVTDGRIVYVQGRIKKGVTDETIVAIAPESLRPSTAYLAFAVFPLHGEDLTKGAAVGHTGDGNITFRIYTPSTGSYGISFFGSYPIGF